MSMEVFVLSQTRLGSIEVWQRAIDSLGFALQLSASRPFDKLRGALPAVLAGRPTAFECDHWDLADLVETYPDLDFKPSLTHVLAFRWGADLRAGIAAYAAAASYAWVTEGVILDCTEGKLITWQRAAEISGELWGGAPQIEAAVRKVIESFRK